MNFNQVDDEILIRLVSHSDKDVSGRALSELYDRYSRLIYSVAYHIVGDGALAEEIIQDVFFRVWDKGNTYRVEEAKVSTWLTSVARNRAIDILRRRRIRPEHSSIPWDNVTNPVVSSQEDPEVSTEIILRHERVHEAIKTLPDDQLKALALSYFYGLSHSQIAERLDEPLGTIKTRIRLAMQKLRDILSDDP